MTVYFVVKKGAGLKFASLKSHQTKPSSSRQNRDLLCGDTRAEHAHPVPARCVVLHVKSRRTSICRVCTRPQPINLPRHVTALAAARLQPPLKLLDFVPIGVLPSCAVKRLYSFKKLQSPGHNALSMRFLELGQRHAVSCRLTHLPLWILHLSSQSTNKPLLPRSLVCLN